MRAPWSTPGSDPGVDTNAHCFTSLGRVVFVLLVSPLSLLDASEPGVVLVDELPDGVVLGLIELDDEPDGDEELSGIVLDDDEDPVDEEPEDDGLIDDDDPDGDDDEGLVVDGDVVEELPEDDGIGGVVVVVVDVVSVVGVAGGSLLWQAPNAATVAARATHLIGLRMFTPRGHGTEP